MENELFEGLLHLFIVLKHGKINSMICSQILMERIEQTSHYNFVNFERSFSSTIFSKLLYKF